MADKVNGSKICHKCGAVWTAKAPKVAPDKAVALPVAEALRASIEAFNPQHVQLRRNIGQMLNMWWPELDLLFRLGAVSWERQRAVCQWMAEGKSHDAEFRRKTVLSAKKLRQHFGTLEGLMHHDGYATPERQAEQGAKVRAIADEQAHKAAIVYARADVREAADALSEAESREGTGAAAVERVDAWRRLVVRAKAKLAELEGKQ